MPLTFLLKCPVIYLVHKEKQIVKNHYYSEIFTSFNKNEVLICRLENAQFLGSFFQTVILYLFCNFMVLERKIVLFMINVIFLEFSFY